MAMRRIVSRPARRTLYWWNENIAKFRYLCVKSRRVWLRAKRAAPSSCDRERLRYRAAKRALRSEISKAKLTIWDELISTIEEDPWGLPYKIVMGRLRSSSSSLIAATHSLESRSPAVLVSRWR